jgi:hypothetical protein
VLRPAHALPILHLQQAFAAAAPMQAAAAAAHQYGPLSSSAASPALGYGAAAAGLGALGAYHGRSAYDSGQGAYNGEPIDAGSSHPSSRLGVLCWTGCSLRAQAH